MFESPYTAPRDQHLSVYIDHGKVTGEAGLDVRVLTINPGSSTLRLRLVDSQLGVISAHDSTAHTPESVRSEVASFITTLDSFDAAGVRFVHGGERYRSHTLVDDKVLSELRVLEDLAPLHNVLSNAAIETLRDAGKPVVACFDTAFHATMPEAAALYAVPREWVTTLGARRYGFHGLSHAYVSRRSAELLGRSERTLRTVSCHLGSGASLAAIYYGQCVDTTMGFTPLDGLVMATRSGSVDPGLITYAQRRLNIGPDELESVLTHRSGLAGLSGRSGDMAELLETAAAGDTAAQIAIDVYIHRLRAGIAAMAAAMNGCDVIAFTGGVGRNAPAIRQAASEMLTFLGIDLDFKKNVEQDAQDRDLAKPSSRTRVLCIQDREDLEMARTVEELLEFRET